MVLLDTNEVKTSDVLLPDHAQALSLLKQGEIELAIQKLTEAMLHSPEDSRIPADLLRALVLEQRFDDAERLVYNLPVGLMNDPQLRNLCAHVELITANTSPDSDMPKLIMNYYMSLEESPDQPEKRLELASILLKIDDIESSLEQLYMIRLHDRAFRNDIGHRGMQALFAMLGDEHELVEKYRLKLEQETGLAPLCQNSSDH